MIGRSAYRAGGFYNTPEHLEALREMDQTAVRILSPHVGYDRPVGRLRSTGALDYAALMQRWQAHLHKAFHTLAPVGGCVLHEAVVCDQVVYSWNDGGFSPLYETQRNIDVFYVGPSDPAVLEAAASMSSYLCCYLGSAGFANYGHWLVDDLPRAILAADIAEEPITWILPSWSPELDRAKLRSIERIFGTPQSVVFVDPKQAVRIPRLLYISPVTYHPTNKSPSALRRVRKALAASRSGPGRRLLVGRAAGANRRLLNTAEVHYALMPLGFESIDPGGLSFDEQVDIFSQAEVVVGVMGAAMTNTLFCPAGTALVYLAPEEWGEPFYWDLAAVMGHDYSCLYGPRVASDLPIHLSDFSVEVPLVISMVQSAFADAAERGEGGDVE